jgi:hypothetical protein
MPYPGKNGLGALLKVPMPLAVTVIVPPSGGVINMICAVSEPIVMGIPPVGKYSTVTVKVSEAPTFALAGAVYSTSPVDERYPRPLDLIQGVLIAVLQSGAVPVEGPSVPDCASKSNERVPEPVGMNPCPTVT